MKRIGIFLTGIVAAIFLISSFKVGAQSASSALSGSCGVVFNLTNPTQALREYSMNSVDDEGLNALGHLNFDVMRASFAITSMVVRGGDSDLVERPVINAEIRAADSTIIPTENGEIVPTRRGPTHLLSGSKMGSSLRRKTFSFVS